MEEGAGKRCSECALCLVHTGFVSFLFCFVRGSYVTLITSVRSDWLTGILAKDGRNDLDFGSRQSVVKNKSRDGGVSICIYCCERSRRKERKKERKKKVGVGVGGGVMFLVHFI